MPKIKIPEDYKPGLAGFFRLTDTQKEGLVGVFNRTPVKTTFDKMADQIAEAISVNFVEARDIARAIDSLFQAKEYGKVPLDDVISGVVEEVALHTDSESNDQHDKNKLSEQLEAFFSKESLYYITTKAASLSTQREQVLSKAKILTDIRPVFSDEPQCDLEGQIILHTLKIDYFQNFENKTIYIALDMEDMKSLKAQIERAEKKAELISEVNSSSEIKILNYP